MTTVIIIRIGLLTQFTGVKVADTIRCECSERNANIITDCVCVREFKEVLLGHT